MLFSKPEDKAQMINVQEANNLWDLAKANYLAVELMQTWENFAHDADFKAVIKTFLTDIKKDIKTLEKELKKHGIPGPDKNRAAVNTAINTEIMMDEYIAQEFFIFAQENVEQLLRAIRTTTTNDGLRALFLKFTNKAIDRLDKVVGYLKIKGWLETPPLYPQTPAEVKETIAAGGVFHLWDHLTFRYDNISQTEIFHAFAKDPEFKALLKVGLQKTLKKQAAMLEKELERLGIPLPKPPKNFAMSDSTELLDDDYMFRILLTGIQGAAAFHAQALKQSTVEDRLRKEFKKLLCEEIGYIDEMIKFGNAKGWLHPVPQYKLQ
ncbi:DUF3231 family protein [Dethiobacter alkaliphilus]|uniref:DUF3231 family protein n=1 Tax=Dethiobacter alkaliphilus TaxID=427926 RepID=UPI002227F990|nr:DUF3231 family protein [Dethiobacter alkaliphilus]MCW3491028.1 DUF3231 family protein [Dethiobacter alkaliphilus]